MIYENPNIITGDLQLKKSATIMLRDGELKIHLRFIKITFASFTIKKMCLRNPESWPRNPRVPQDTV